VTFSSNHPAHTVVPTPDVIDLPASVSRAITAVGWRVLVTAPLDGAANMALDEALMHRAERSDEAVLRVYGWARPTLSLGRNQVARGKYDVEGARERGVDIVRRPTGGRAVLHHREVTYSVTAPVSAFGTLRESYATINRLLIHGLRLLGVDAMEADPRGVTPKPGVLPCFVLPSKGEIVAEGRKLVGSAQVREGGALLQHGSVLVDDDQALASSLLLAPAAPPPPPATLRALLGRAPSLEEVASAFATALPEAHRLDEHGDPLLEHDARLAAERYRDPAWTWRR
jgi:lipoate-protein ligase A